MKKYIIEFIGAFFLILTIALTGNPLAIGVVLITLVYMGGYISGAHYNPAVTLAVLLIGKIHLNKAIGYMLVQVLGGIAAAGVYFVIHGSKFIPEFGPHISWMQALPIEILFTFLLASVVLNVALAPKTKDNDYYGLAIGLALMVGAFAGGPISGGVFNPAVALGPMLFDIGHLNVHFANLAVYLIGPFFGGILASYVYRLK